VKGDHGGGSRNSQTNSKGEGSRPEWLHDGILPGLIEHYRQRHLGSHRRVQIIQIIPTVFQFHLYDLIPKEREGNSTKSFDLSLCAM
jgi:hypothetical protein